MEIAKEFDNVFLQEIQEIYHLNNIGIVDEARMPEKPYNINHAKDMILFFVMGLGASFACLVIFYLLDNTIKKEEEIEKYIHLKSLGSIPLSQDKEGELASRDNAKSYVTECINTIRTNILYMNSAKNAKTILITSCTPQEGKSWVSANIANAFAETDKKVLLIDSDLRKGRAHKIFKVNNQEGLSNYLYNMTEERNENINLAKKYIQETTIPNLHILTNGNVPPNPAELLESNQMKELLELLKNIYDVIIIDAPPCKLVTDSIVLSTIVDSTILVANSEKTKMKDFNEVRKSIQMVGGEIIGAILNKKKLEGKTYHNGYYYYGNAEESTKQKKQEKKQISVEKVIEEAGPILENKELVEENEKIEVEKETTDNLTDMKKFISNEMKELQKDYKELESAVKNTNYIEILLKKAEEEKLTETQIEAIIKQEIIKIDYSKQIEQMNEMLTNLKDSYLELSNQMKANDVKEIEEQPGETSNKNIIDFKAFKKQRNKKVYSIEEDIAYEDLEQTATYVIPLRTSFEGSYQKSMY